MSNNQNLQLSKLKLVAKNNEGTTLRMNNKSMNYF